MIHSPPFCVCHVPPRKLGYAFAKFMFRFFRKHSWILIVTLTLTIGSFVLFMGMGPSRSGGGGRSGGGEYGPIYGHSINADAYAQAQREFYVSYWMQNGEWPDKSPSITPSQIQQQVYSFLLFQLKAKDLGIYVGNDAVVSAASDLLRSPTLMQKFGTSEPVPPAQFVQQVLAPEGLTAADFESAIRSRLEISQLVDVLGLPGALITPQEADTLYNRENQEISAQAVFFSASNYISQVAVTPAVVAQFYTNNMAAYREPDRVQVSYVAFSASNFLTQAKAELARTNFEENVESLYQRYGATPQFADEKTPADAKAKIRELLINHRALDDAEIQANNFVTALYAMTPVKPENLAALAKQQNLPVAISEPFAETTGPEDFDATTATALTKAAFQLNADSPYTGPIIGKDAVYVIALANQLPSEIPSFDQIRGRVAQDFQTQQAVTLAQNAGTNFYYSAAGQLAAGKKFVQAAVAAGEAPVILSPFSLLSSEVPELGDHAEIGQLKQAAFTTPPGRISRFVPTADGGFVLFVQSLLPVDQSKKAADFPQYLAQARRARQSEAFNLWLNTEFNREIASKPFFQQQQQQLAGAAK